MNNSGKTLTIFLVLIAILLICVTGISAFFYVQQVELREVAEEEVAQLQSKEAKMKKEIKKINKKLFVSEEKNKEAEEKIENLMEEIELEQGLREELKKENRGLQDRLSRKEREKDEVEEKMSQDIVSAEEKAKSLEEKLDSTIKRNTEIEAQRQEIETQYQELKKKFESESKEMQKKVEELESGVLPPAQEAPVSEPKASLDLGEVDLETIVINSSEEGGRIISVDKATDFVIVSLGKKEGVSEGTLLSVYRGKKYLGDIKISRILPEMSAADFVPPLRSQKVRKNDQVVIKSEDKAETTGEEKSAE